MLSCTYFGKVLIFIPVLNFRTIRLSWAYLCNPLVYFLKSETQVFYLLVPNIKLDRGTRLAHCFSWEVKISLLKIKSLKKNDLGGSQGPWLVADQLSYHLSPDPGLWVSSPWHLLHLWAAGAAEEPALQNQSCRIFTTLAASGYPRGVLGMVQWNKKCLSLLWEQQIMRR